MADMFTVVGRLGADPRTGSTGAGKAFTNLRIATNDRRRGESGDWVDGPTSWYSVSVYGRLAEHAAASVHKGDRVIVTGALSVKEYTGGDGQTRTEAHIVAQAVGHDLAFGTSTFARAGRSDAPRGDSERSDTPQVPAATPDHSNDWGVPAIEPAAAAASAADDQYLPGGEPSWFSAA